MSDYVSIFKDMGQRARLATQALQRLTTAEKNALLSEMQHSLVSNIVKILDANEKDVEEARAAHVSEAMIDRLRLTGARIESMASDMEQVIALPDPVGRVLDAWTRPNGLEIQKISVPLGVILMIYESRPNVTVDATILSLKAGNAVILRGGKEAFHTNRVLVDILRRTAQQQGVSPDIVQMVPVADRDAVSVLLTQKDYIDVVIPRGSAGLIERVVRESRIPVLETGSGVCHAYVDASADIRQALQIVMNGKVQRPSVCNALETVLIHENVALDFLKLLIPALVEEGVDVRLDAPSMECARRLQMLSHVHPATEDDWSTEYNDLILSIKVVRNIEEALTHIAAYGTKHSECIITRDSTQAQRFQREVDAACVYVNSSTRFTDGEMFGFGAEIGISTQKLHARGPMALPELTSYKYLITGTGQVRT